MPEGAFRVHGLSSEFLKDKPVFADIADDFLTFVGEATLIAHNASFDLGFINAELDRLEMPALPRDRLLDTLLLARRKHPNGPNKLDDLCGRYGIDNSRRTKHGALLDAEILADVYLEMIGARQAQLGLGQEDAAGIGAGGHRLVVAVRTVVLAPRLSDAERSAHRAFVAKLGDNALWREYLEPDELPDANAA
jgi:DNA polymerase-3 subunit epsilon